MCLNNRPAENSNNGSVGTSNPTNVLVSSVVDASGTQDSSGTTTFITDANIVSADINFRQSMHSSNYSSSSDEYKQEIKDFMAKPTILLTNVFANTDGIGSFATTIQPHNALSLNTLYTNKLSGYLGFRATQVIRIVVNANKFQQGRYIMYAVQLGGSASTSALAVAAANTNTLVQRTTIPHVEVDLACDSEAIMKIPYVSALNYFPMSALLPGRSVYGAVFQLGLVPYVPLSSGTGSSTCGFTIWSHFEDVELIGPAVPQSGSVYSKSKKKNESETERSQNMRPLSSTLIRVSKAASLFNDIPLLSDYSSTVSWATDILAKTASSFGFSRPNNVGSSSRITRNILPYLSTIDGADNSLPASYSVKNMVGPAVGFSGTKIDEMDFSYIASIPAWSADVPWGTATGSGALLMERFVSPVTDTFSNVQNGLTYVHFKPMSFVAEYFKYWRGSIVYKFKLVKTEYHSGRLCVSFNPASSATGATPIHSLNDSNYLHREIIDIRDCNEFTFVVPYISTTPYSTTNATKNSCQIGRVAVHVMEPLVAPDTVSGTIRLICEMSAGPDMEFAVPKRHQYSPALDVIPQMGDIYGGKPNACSIAETNIGASSPISGDNNINAINCVGEKILSFRQLLKVSSLLLRTSSAVPGSGNNFFNITPFGTGHVINQAIPQIPYVSADLYSVLSACYVFSRGGVRFKNIFNVNGAVSTNNVIGTNNITEKFIMDNDLVTSWLSFNDPVAASLSRVATVSTSDHEGISNPFTRIFSPTQHELVSNGSIEVQVPQYHRYHSRINSECITSLLYPYNNNDGGFAPNVYLSIKYPTSATPTTNLLYRSCADDANFGTFKSVPPMTVVNPLGFNSQ